MQFVPVERPPTGRLPQPLKGKPIGEIDLISFLINNVRQTIKIPPILISARAKEWGGTKNCILTRNKRLEL